MTRLEKLNFLIENDYFVQKDWSQSSQKAKDFIFNFINRYDKLNHNDFTAKILRLGLTGQDLSFYYEQLRPKQRGLIISILMRITNANSSHYQFENNETWKHPITLKEK